MHESWVRLGSAVAGLVLLAFATAGAATGGSPVQTASPVAIRMLAGAGVPVSEIQSVRATLAAIRPRIDADFAVAGRPTLTVDVFASNSAYARTFHRLEGLWPEGRQDTTGNVVHGVMPIGPPNAYLEHNLAHIYTEWVLDRLTHNTDDRQPSPAWLYDGIAEWEADRVGTPLSCHLTTPYVLPLASIASPRQWWATRATIFGGLEYCEAESATARLVDRTGWDRLVTLLHRAGSWQRFARDLGVSG
jgi:hypothetical protein